MFLATACVAEGPEWSSGWPPAGEGKEDVATRVSQAGPLGWDDDGAAAGAFEEDLEFHGYTLATRAGARVTLEVTQRGSSRGLDTVLLVYGPQDAAGGFGARALLSDDDSGWGRLSRLRDVTLVEGGTYLLVVGTKDARGRGRYRLRASCLSGDCTPPPVEPPAGACHPLIARAIDDCVRDYVENDPDYFYRMAKRDLVEQCADVEVVAPAYDALCSTEGPRDPLCALDLERLSLEHLPLCLREAWNRELDSQCVFGERYRDLFQPGAIVIMGERRLTRDSALSDTEARQLLDAVRVSAYRDVGTVEEAFDAVDEGTVFHTELWDASNRRAFTAYEFGAGDNSYGRIFEFGVTRPAATIYDGDLGDCRVTWGPEFRECDADAACAPGLRCHGRVDLIGRGRCVAFHTPEHPAAESSCDPMRLCPAGSGLQCAGLATGGEQGICRPAWLTGKFLTTPDQPIPDNAPDGVLVPLVAYGLATVAEDLWIDLFITHPRVFDLRVSLINPAETEAVIFDGTRDGASDLAPVPSELVLRNHLVRGIPGDESCNGAWYLRVVDTRRGQVGTIRRVGLTITSRWD